MYQIEYSGYPDSVSLVNNEYCPPNGKYCFKSSPGNKFEDYSADNGSNPQTFTINSKNTSSSVGYNITHSTAPSVIAASDWIAGKSSTPMSGKFIYRADLDIKYAYKNSPTANRAPQSVVGLDPDYPTWSVLVSPQSNPEVDFTTSPDQYPAQNACKLIGGRLPTMNELQSIQINQAPYGNNFQNGFYWSATENSFSNANLVAFGTYRDDPNTIGWMWANSKYNTAQVRCVKN